MKVIGIGGVFFKAKNSESLREWYFQKLGITYESWGSFFMNNVDLKGS